MTCRDFSRAVESWALEIGVSPDDLLHLPLAHVGVLLMVARRRAEASALLGEVKIVTLERDVDCPGAP